MSRYLAYISQVLFLLVISTGSLFGQYWQQYVEYDMDILLNAEDKTLIASSDLLYVNQSPDTLDCMLMHLYHNAFNKGTIVEALYGKKYKIDEKGWTGITIESAVSDSLPMTFKVRDDTILDISLHDALMPGDTLRFTLEWVLTIHPHIDRSGYRSDQFDFAQWYPKFVVYDENGWHDDPFGDWGEFYGEFGNFTVHLDVPAGQIVGASGVVIDGDPGWSEVTVDTSIVWDDWVENFRVSRGEALAELDSTERRTVSFFAENIHDFAWLCSPDFVYEYGNWNGIDVHALFTSQVGSKWTKDVVKHGKQAIEWLSGKFGPYPYPQMTITKALLSGGMEYPMLIMDASDSESLIVHEIGHNWFYGLFGNDELDDAWLDEGFTTFQTDWYKAHYYPKKGYPKSRGYLTDFENEKLPKQMYVESKLKSVLYYMKSPRNEPIARHSYDFIHRGSYRSNVYDKASIMLHSLKSYLGEERFLAGMQLYYERWALKHVNEDRLIKSMEDGCGEELDWFFDQWLHTTNYVDYALAGWTTEKVDENKYNTKIQIENKGGMFVPLPVTIYGENSQTASTTLSEFKFRSNSTIEIESEFEPQRVILDAENHFFDSDRRNNDSKKKDTFRYNFKGWNDYPDDRNLFLWKPQFGYNDLDGIGIGVKLDRVYRKPGDFITLELDYNLLSGIPDASISFKQDQIGLPTKAVFSGDFGSWRSLNYARMAYELNWAKRFWRNPIHYLTLGLDYTDASRVDSDPIKHDSFSRFSVQYEFQNNLLGGNYGFSTLIHFSPGPLGDYSSDFSQLSLMSNWNRQMSWVRINNRSNFLYNSSATPEMVKSRLASKDSKEMYLDRLASSLHNIDDISSLGGRYYLSGGARMRAYTDSLNVRLDYAWSNSTDIAFTEFTKFGRVSLSIFADIGQTSADAKEWTLVGDAGVGVKYSPSWKRTNWLTTLIRPVTFKFELPLTRIENESWEAVHGEGLWVFSITL